MECGEDNKCISDNIKDGNYDGLIGSYYFDNNGDMRGLDIAMKIISGGKSQIIK